VTLVDADVLIELQRKSPQAIAWAESARNIDVNVPGIAALELVIGSRDKNERDRASRFVGQLRVLWMNEADHLKAYELAEMYGLSTGLGLGDLLIAAQALNRNAVLLTFNLRHFGAVSGLKVVAPYARD
jgi:predicted nucleic acid-binding protein